MASYKPSLYWLLVITSYTPHLSFYAAYIHLVRIYHTSQVNVVGDAMLFLGKLAIASCCGLVAFGMANLRYYNDIDVSGSA